MKDFIKRKMPTVLTCSIFMLIGLVFMLITGIFLATGVSGNKNYIATEAEIVEVWGTTPVFEFELPNGTTVQASPGESGTIFKKGKTMEIYYDPTDPSRIQTKVGSNMLMFIFGGIGGGFFLIPIIIFIANIAKQGSKSNLKKTIRPVKGTVVECKVIYTVRVSSSFTGTRHPKQLICECSEYPDMTFKSDYIWEDVTDMVGETVDIYIDPNKPSKYLIELSSNSEEKADILERLNG